MGFNFSAVATSDKFSKESINSFSVRFFCKMLMFKKEVVFEECLIPNFQEEYLDILFLETGTLIFGSNPTVLEKLNIRKNSFNNYVGLFSIEETSMVYVIDYFEDTKRLISIIEHNGETISNDHENSNIEFSNGFELTVRLIEKIVGKNFYEFEPDLKLFRYKFLDVYPTPTIEDTTWLANSELSIISKNELNNDFKNVGEFINGVAVAQLDGKYGLIDEQRNKLSKFKYDRIEYFKNEETVIKIKINNKWGCLDNKGNEIIPAIYDDISEFKEGFACVKKQEKFGCIDLQNNLIIPIKYERIGTFSDGFVTVRLNGKYGFINNQGVEITPFIYDDTWGFNGKFAFVCIDRIWSAIDRNGKIVKVFEYESIFSLGSKKGQLHNVQKNGKWGCINDDFDLVIDCIYNNWIIFFEGLANVTRYLVNKGELDKPFEKISYVNLEGKEIIPYVCDEGRAFVGGYAAVRKVDKWGFINTKGEVVVPIIYDLVEDHKNGILRVVKDGQGTQIRTDK